MKRLFEIILFCLLTAALQASSPDTTGLISRLKVDTFRLEIIPPSSGVRFYRNGIVFLSNTKDEGKMLPKHVSFGTNEAYTALLKDSSLGLHILFSPATSFSYPCEAMTFSSDFKTMYYTMIPKKEKREKIFRAEYKPDSRGDVRWIMDANPLEFCTGNYIFTHPALSSDGKILIFASDMNGTYGELDLFMVRKDGDKWSKPENLGKPINTAMNECYPFLDPDNNLYYSSDGLPGMGGFDIFTCRFDGEKWDKPVNLSSKLNSADDDIAFSIEKSEGRIAFYTRKRIAHPDKISLFKVSLKNETTGASPLTISYIFNGKAGEKHELLAATPDNKPKTGEKEPDRTVPAETKVQAPPPSKQPAAKTTATKPAGSSTSAASPEPSNVKSVTIKPISEVPQDLKNVVVYRIQFLSTGTPRKEKQVLLNGVPYKTFEYLYLGSYRYTIGEYTTLAPARELQSICRKSGYPDAFVAAFKGDRRSLDLANFK